jgi:hypothetical protein
VSRQARDWAWEQLQVTGNRKVVLLYVAERADERGHCWPRLKTIAQGCGLNPHTASTHLRELERDGLLRRARQRRADGAFTGRVLILLAMPSGLNGPVDPAAFPGHPSGLSGPVQGPNGAGAVTATVPEPSLEPSPSPPPVNRYAARGGGGGNPSEKDNDGEGAGE